MAKAKSSLAAIAQTLRQSPFVLVTTHRSPDGDGLGAGLALTRALAKLGLRAVMYNPDPCPDALRFLPGSGDLVTALPAAVPDTVVIVDCSEPERVAPDLAARLAPKTWIVIDHHATEAPFGDLRHNDAAAPASSEIVLRLLAPLGVALDPEMAACLYAGLAVDTGNFRFSNATARAFEAAAELTAAGADAPRIAHLLFEEQPVSKLKLTAAALGTLELALGGALATLAVDEAMLAAADASLADLDGLVNFPRALRGCRVAAVYLVQGDEVRISLRTSVDAVDVERVAREFGGGGHKHAAGCSLRGTLAEARGALAAAVARMLAEVGA